MERVARVSEVIAASPVSFDEAIKAGFERASRTLRKAEKLIGGHERGKALPLDVKDQGALEPLVKQCDLAISLLPYTHHVAVANLCIQHRRNLITTSYVSPAMQELDGRAERSPWREQLERLLGEELLLLHVDAGQPSPDTVGSGAMPTTVNCSLTPRSKTCQAGARFGNEAVVGSKRPKALGKSL